MVGVGRAEVFALHPVDELSVAPPTAFPHRRGCFSLPDGSVGVIYASEPVDRPTSKQRGWIRTPTLEFEFATAVRFVTAQPLPDGRWWIVAARSRDGWGAEIIDPLGPPGALRPRVAVGDGISHAEVDAEGRLWVGYFDQGIFGGGFAAGLVRFDPDGGAEIAKPGWEYRSPSGTIEMADCYALNVVSPNEVWVCPYTDFPIIRIRRGKEELIRASPVHGASAFAVRGDRWLFSGGYAERDRFHLVHQGGVDEITLVDAPDGPRFARGSRMYVANAGPPGSERTGRGDSEPWPTVVRVYDLAELPWRVDVPSVSR